VNWIECATKNADGGVPWSTRKGGRDGGCCEGENSGSTGGRIHDTILHPPGKDPRDLQKGKAGREGNEEEEKNR
jgi:hypothetical protein